MPNDYKKRAKGSWNVGKSHKDDSSERAYAKNEIKQELKTEETDLTRYKAKRKRNKKAKLEHLIAWYTQKIEEFGKDQNNTSVMVYLFRSALEKLTAEYQKLLEKK